MISVDTAGALLWSFVVVFAVALASMLFGAWSNASWDGKLKASNERYESEIRSMSERYEGQINNLSGQVSALVNNRMPGPLTLNAQGDANIGGNVIGRDATH